MMYQWFVLFSLAKLLVAFAVFFVYLPARILPQSPGASPIERFFENFVPMLACGIALVHVLSLLHIYSIFALLVGYTGIWAGLLWWRDRISLIRRIRKLRAKHVVLVFSILDRMLDVRVWLRAWLRARIELWRRHVVRDRSSVVHALLFVAVLIWAGVLRYLDVFRQAAFAFSDPYTHLLWLKQVESGILYGTGNQQFYPKGYHAFVIILRGLSGLDATIALRLTGPLVGLLLVLAVYHAGRRLTGSREAALVGMALYGGAIQLYQTLGGFVVEDGQLTFTGASLFWFLRQTTPLPEEFALVFLVPALLWAHTFLTRGGRRPLALFAAAGFCIFLVHSLVGMALGLGFALLCLLGLLLWAIPIRTLLTASLVALGVALVSNLQLLYGLLFTSAVTETGTRYFSGWLTKYVPAPWGLETIVSGALAALLLLGGLLLAPGRPLKLLWGFIGLFLGSLAFLGRSEDFGIRYLIPPDRLSHYRIFLLAPVAAGLYHVATLSPILGAWYRRQRWFYLAMTTVAVTALLLVGFPQVLFTAESLAPRYEYDALARTAFRIKRSFPPLEWTIVSTVEDYSKVLKAGGWHMNGDEFIRTFSPYDPDPAFPTPLTFLFVEQKPWGLSSDRELNRPGARLDLQRRMLEWANLYRLFHDDMSIYYEDFEVTVFVISRKPSSGLRRETAPARPPSPHSALDGLWQFLGQATS